jgi:hypothetical protein
LLIDSSPPATAIDTSPARIWSAAIMMAFMPEPHILLMVVVGTPLGMAAPSAAWRAGAWAQSRGQHAAHHRLPARHRDRCRPG